MIRRHDDDEFEPETFPVVCPACVGEGRYPSGEWWVEPATGAASPIMVEPCEICGGCGWIEEPGEPINEDDFEEAFGAPDP
jgi:hypothetical protein